MWVVYRIIESPISLFRVLHVDETTLSPVYCMSTIIEPTYKDTLSLPQLRELLSQEIGVVDYFIMHIIKVIICNHLIAGSCDSVMVLK